MMRFPSVLTGLLHIASLICAAKIPFEPRALPKCTLATFQGMMPPNAKVENVTRVTNGGTFDEGSRNLGYPSPPYNPTGLPELCAVIINVTSSPSSNYRFGMFLPTSWNNRFLMVGNGGFAGGINWYDMAPGNCPSPRL
jgi:feruloyl esterase